MTHLAIVFPGQGSQYVGMGADLHDAFPPVREAFAEAGEVLGMDIAGLCFHGPQARLDETLYTQIAVLTVEMAFYRLFSQDIRRPPLVMAGHSLGEFAALYASGAIGFAPVLRLVRARALRHQEGVPPGRGAMAAILGLTADRVRPLVDSVSGVVDLAIVNGPGQAVISGETEAVERVMALARENGASQVVRLAISVPCHSRLLQEAAETFSREDLALVSFGDGAAPVIPNCDPAVFHTAETSSDLLRRQMISPVRWQETVERMIRLGVDTVVEIGPRHILSGLIRRIDRRIRLLQVEDIPSWERTKDALTMG